MYRAKAKTIAQAVARDCDGHVYSLQACYGTRLQRRLSFVEIAEKSSDWFEFVRLKRALAQYGSVREAIKRGLYP